MGKKRVGFFKKKKKLVPTTEEITSAAVASVFDDSYRDELRQLGRQYFSQIITEDKESLRREFTRTFTETSNDLRTYIRRQLSTVVDHLRQELARDLESQMAEHRRLLNEAEDAAIQSLTRNSQELHERYSQLSRTLERTVAEQEVKMASVFADSEQKLVEAQSTQTATLQQMKSSADSAERSAASFQQSLSASIEHHNAQTSQLMESEQQQLNQVSQAQTAAVEAVRASAQALEQQYSELRQSIDGTVERQKTMLVEGFTQNFAQIVENYLLAALGDQFEVKDQLPGIIGQLEADKQTIADDAKL